MLLNITLFPKRLPCFVLIIALCKCNGGNVFCIQLLFDAYCISLLIWIFSVFPFNVFLNVLHFWKCNAIVYLCIEPYFVPTEKYEKSLGIARQTIDCLKVYINGMQHSCNNELHYETYLHCSVIWLWFWLNIKRHSVLCLCMWIEGGGVDLLHWLRSFVFAF